MEGRVLNNNQDNQDQKDQNDSQDRGVNEPNRSEQKQRKSFSKHVIGGVVGILVVLLIIVGVLGYRYFDNATQPYDSSDNRVVQVDIPYGANCKKIADFTARKGDQEWFCLWILDESTQLIKLSRGLLSVEAFDVTCSNREGLE